MGPLRREIIEDDDLPPSWELVLEVVILARRLPPPRLMSCPCAAYRITRSRGPDGVSARGSEQGRIWRRRAAKQRARPAGHGLEACKGSASAR